MPRHRQLKPRTGNGTLVMNIPAHHLTVGPKEKIQEEIFCPGLRQVNFISYFKLIAVGIQDRMPKYSGIQILEIRLTNFKTVKPLMHKSKIRGGFTHVKRNPIFEATLA